MFDFYQKRKLRTILNAPLTQAVLLVLVGMLAWSAYVRFDIALEMRDRREVAEQEVATLETRKAALEAEVEYLSSERGIEAEMRRQFDVALPGEQVVVIVEEESDTPEVLPLTATSTEERAPRWYEFWR